MLREASKSKVNLRTEHVKKGKQVKVPEGWEISHTCLIEPKKGRPYFAVLMKNENKTESGQVGFKVV